MDQCSINKTDFVISKVNVTPCKTTQDTWSGFPWKYSISCLNKSFLLNKFSALWQKQSVIHCHVIQCFMNLFPETVSNIATVSVYNMSLDIGHKTLHFMQHLCLTKAELQTWNRAMWSRFSQWTEMQTIAVQMS